MGMALAAKRGKSTASAKIRRLADSMTEKQLRDFAKTKRKGLPEKKAQDVIPSPQEQEEVFKNYVKPSNRGPMSYLGDKATNTLLPNELKTDEFLGKTSPAHVLAGVYGKNLGGEVNKANQYNTKYNYPLIGPSTLSKTNVYSAKNSFTIPNHTMTGINKSPDLFQGMSDLAPEDYRDNAIVNGLQPLKPGIDINKPSREFLASDKFVPHRVKPIMPIQHLLEHEIGGHRVYEDSAVNRLPKALEWPKSLGMQPYQNLRGEAMNGLAAIQRDQFQNTGKRYESPSGFSGDLNKVLSSPDIEKAMDTQGWGRTDAKRLIRSLVPMEPKSREEFINQAARAMPGIVRNNTTKPIKTGEYYHDSEDIDEGVKTLENYLKSQDFKNPDNGYAERLLMAAAIGVPATVFGGMLLSDNHKEDNNRLVFKTAEYTRMKKGLTKKAFLSGFIKRAAEYGFSEKEAASLFDKAEEGWGDLNLNRFQGRFPEIGTEHNPGIMAHLKRNAGKYVGAGIGIPLALYLKSQSPGYVPGTFLAAGLPMSLGSSIDALREKNHIEKLLQKPESLTHLKNLVNNRTEALHALQGGIDEDLRRFSPAEAK
jgi:hypothetical protein